MQAVASVLVIACNVFVPSDAPYHGFGVYNTEYRTVMNHTNQRCFFELTTQPNVIWADVAKFDLKARAPVMVLELRHITTRSKAFATSTSRQ